MGRGNRVTRIGRDSQTCVHRNERRWASDLRSQGATVTTPDNSSCPVGLLAFSQVILKVQKFWVTLFNFDIKSSNHNVVI